MEILALRHPVSLWNEFEIHQGQCRNEPGLSAQGILQGRKIAEWSSALAILGIWVSPLPRTLQLARIISESRPHHIPLFLTPDLMEITHGEIDGMPYKKIKKHYRDGLKKWKSGVVIDEPCFPGGETLRAAQERGIHAFLAAARAAYELQHGAGEVALIISHGALLKLTLAQFFGMSIENGSWRTMAQENGCINSLSWDGREMNIIEINHTAHLGDTRYTPKINI